MCVCVCVCVCERERERERERECREVTCQTLSQCDLHFASLAKKNGTLYINLDVTLVRDFHK